MFQERDVEVDRSRSASPAGRRRRAALRQRRQLVGSAAGSGSTTSTRADGKKIKVGLVTDIGGLNDRSFNALANKGLRGRQVASSGSTGAC